MNTINFELVTALGDFRHCVEASTLGLRPGEWPASLDVDPKFGNGQPLVRGLAQWSDGELQAVEYHQALGVLILVVFND